MPALVERDQVGKREQLADIIANVEAEATPFTSMLPKRSKPNQTKIDWQAKAYRTRGHKGVLDSQDATNFTHNPRKLLSARSQKIWELPAVSDFSEESVVAGEAKGEMAGQIADGLVVCKRTLERRNLSNEESGEDNGSSQANETRGILKWVQNAAQTHYPVPEEFRTPLASIHSGTLAAFTESVLKGLCRSAYKQRKGTGKLDGFVGVDLKQKFTDFASYQDDVASTTAVRQFTQSAESRALINVVDKLVLDTGEIDLHLISFGWTDPDTGEDTNYTHRSGVLLDMEFMGMCYTRLPRVVRLPYLGGGYKAIVDAIWALMCDNPLGAVAMKISADS